MFGKSSVIRIFSYLNILCVPLYIAESPSICISNHERTSMALSRKSRQGNSKGCPNSFTVRTIEPRISGKPSINMVTEIMFLTTEPYIKMTVQNKYIIIQIILAFSLVLTHDQLGYRRKDDVIDNFTLFLYDIKRIDFMLLRV